MKRQDYISWDEYFMGVAELASLRSKDPNTQVGACIVDQHNKILSIGYNGFPMGCDDDLFPWGNEKGEENFFIEFAYLGEKQSSNTLIIATFWNQYEIFEFPKIF